MTQARGPEEGVAVTAAGDEGPSKAAALGLTDRRVMVLTTVFTALGPISMSMYAPAMPSLAVAFNTSVSMVQLTLTFYLIAFAFAQLVHGPLSDRFGRKPILIIGILIFLVGSLGAALAPTITILIVARFVQAIGVCAGTVIARAIVRDLYDGAAAARVLAAIGMALAVAPAVGPVLGGYLDMFVGWRAIFYFHTVCGALIGWLTWHGLPETHSRRNRGALDLRSMAGSFVMILRNAQFLGYATINACTLGGLFLFAAVGPFVFISTLGLSPALYGWLTLLTTGAYFIGASIARHQSGHRELRSMVLMGAAFSLTGGLVLMLVAATGIVTVASVIVPIMLLTLGVGLSMPGAMAGALSPFPTVAGTASSLLGFLQMGTGAVGTIIAGFFGEGAIWALALVPTISMVFGLAVFLTLVPRERMGAHKSPRLRGRI